MTIKDLMIQNIRTINMLKGRSFANELDFKGECTNLYAKNIQSIINENYTCIWEWLLIGLSDGEKVILYEKDFFNFWEKYLNYYKTGSYNDGDNNDAKNEFVRELPGENLLELFKLAKCSHDALEVAYKKSEKDVSCEEKNGLDEEKNDN